MKVIVLGHNGMLGHILVKFLLEKNIQVITTDSRWKSKEFISFIKETNADHIVNCIGQIPQKNKPTDQYIINNFELPIFLSENSKAYLTHVTTDCEFAGTTYKKEYTINDLPDSQDEYGRSKRIATEQLLKNNNCSIIRSSIIGPELSFKKSLWEWFVNCDLENINGYSNHFWNGVTTLEWSSKYLDLIINKKLNKGLIQLGSPIVSKYDILQYLNKNLNLNKNILKFETDFLSKTLKPDYLSCDLEKQIKQLIDWYY